MSDDESNQTVNPHEARADRNRIITLENDIRRLTQQLTNLQNVARNPAPVAPPPQQLVRRERRDNAIDRLEPFRGGINASFADFHEQFERYAKYFNWDEPEKLNKLPFFLEEHALDVYRDLTDAEKNNYDASIRALGQNLQPVALSKFCANELMGRKILTGETSQQYRAALLKLCRNGYPNFDQAQLNDLLLPIFLRGLRPQHLRQTVLNADPENLDTAVNKATLFEANNYLLNDTTPSRTGVYTSFTSTTRDVHSTNASHGNSHSNATNADAVEKLTKLCGETIATLRNAQAQTDYVLTINAKQQREQARQMTNAQINNDSNMQHYQLNPPRRQERRWTTNGDPICDYCKRVGHISHNCRMRRNARTEQFTPRFHNDFPHRNYQSNLNQDDSFQTNRSNFNQENFQPSFNRFQSNAVDTTFHLTDEEREWYQSFTSQPQENQILHEINTIFTSPSTVTSSPCKDGNLKEGTIEKVNESDKRDESDREASADSKEPSEPSNNPESSCTHQFHSVSAIDYNESMANSSSILKTGRSLILGSTIPTFNLVNFLIGPTPIRFGNKRYMHYCETGELVLQGGIPTLHNFNQLQSWSRHETIWHQIVFERFDTAQSHDNLNDLSNKMQPQQIIMKGLAIIVSNNTDGTVMAVANHITRRGFFSFLIREIFDLKQFWIFLCCVYVTIVITIRRFLPRIKCTTKYANAPALTQHTWKLMHDRATTFIQFRRTICKTQEQNARNDQRQSENHMRLKNNPNERGHIVPLQWDQRLTIEAPPSTLANATRRQLTQNRLQIHEALKSAISAPLETKPEVPEHTQSTLAVWPRNRNYRVHHINALPLEITVRSHKIKRYDWNNEIPISFISENLALVIQLIVETINQKRPNFQLPRVTGIVRDVDFDVHSPIGSFYHMDTFFVMGELPGDMLIGKQLALRLGEKYDDNLFGLMELVGSSKTSMTCIYINDAPIIALIDTGSAVTFMSEQALLRIPQYVLLPRLIHAKAATGDALKIIGSSNTDIKIGNSVHKHLIHVCRDLPYDAIIGEDFLKKLGRFTIDYANEILEINESRVSLAPRSKLQYKQYSVRATETCDISTQTEAVFSTEIDFDQAENSTTSSRVDD
ncbi:MAG: retroviral-like aspartic protease [Cytophagales bacterium]|nr:retroviral-like aspartic protease [Cytophagales bacterium]